MNESESTVQSAERKYGPLDPPEAHPPRSPRSRLSIVLGVLCVVLAIICCVLLVRMGAAVNTANQLEERNRSLLYENMDLVLDKNNLKRQLTEEKDSLKALTSELDFWESTAVLVTDSGQKYHTWDCQYVADKDYWIYNVENAIYKGYQPCRVCDPPER